MFNLKKYAVGSNSLAALSLVLISVVVYGAVITYPFLPFDDQVILFTNTKLIEGDWLFFWKHQYQLIYMPITFSAWVGLFKIFGMSPAIFHGAVFLCHTLNALLVFLIINFFLKSRISSFVGALFFLVHPIQVEVVAWAQGFRDALGLFFVLCSTYLWLYSDKSHFRKFGSLVFFACAILSKPTMMVAIFLLVVYEISKFLYSEDSRKKTHLLKNLAILSLMTPLVFFVFKVNSGVQANIVKVVGDLNLYEKLILVFNNAAFYIKQIFYPNQFFMNYGRTPSIILSEPHQYINVLLVVLFLAAFVFYFKKNKERELKIASLFFGSGLVLFFTPTSGIIPFEFQAHSAVADRYCYGVMFSLAFFTALAYRHLLNWDKVLLRRVLIFSLFLVLSFTNLVHSLNWSKQELFFKAYLEGNPNNIKANLGLADFLVGIGKDEEAEGVFRKALEIDPSLHQAVSGLFTALYNMKKYNEIDEFLKKYDEKTIIEYLKMPEDVRFFIYYFSSEVYFEQQRYDKASYYWCNAAKYKKFDPALKLSLLFEKIRIKFAKISLCANS